MHHKSAKVMGPAAVLALVAAVLAGCGSDDSDASGGGDTIKVGNISGVTGPFPLGDGANGAQAHFDAINADGGIGGKDIEFIIADDKTDPALSARAARDLARQDVVALVGDLTLVGCGVNRSVLEQNDLRSLMVASDPACFTQPNVAPVNAGQVTDWKLTMVYAAEQLGKENVCAIFTNAATLMDGNDEAIAYFEETTGKKLAWVDKTLNQNSNLSAMMATAKEKNCDVVLTDGTPDQAPPLIKARDEQGLDAAVIFQGALYDTAAAEALGDAEEVYSIAEMEPFTGDAEIVQQMKSELDAAGQKVNALSQFGWTAAYIFGEVAKGIDGPVTKDAVNKALLALDDFDTQGLTATPFAFGDADAHNPNRGGKIVKVVDGKWTVETPDWLTLE